MMSSLFPIAKEVVLVGGGHTHALLLRSWGMKPIAGVRLTVINPAPSAPYTGMLPGHIAGHYARDDLEIDLVTLARHADARLILGRVDGIDPTAQRLSVRGRPDIPFDIASLDIGITSDMPRIPGFSEFAVAAKPLGPFAMRWRGFLETCEGQPIVVIGGGIGGIELALAMQHQTSTIGAPSSVTIIDSEKALMGVAPTARHALRDELRRTDIRLIENTSVASVSSEDVELDDGQRLPAALVVGAAGARPFDWLEETGLALTDGFVTVDRSLRSISHPMIYAAGDCAHLAHAPRPKAGVFAVRAAPVLTHNIRADLTGSARKSFIPQSSYLKLISLGDKRALTDKWGIALRGEWVWSWKDKIDQKFMDKLRTLPVMTTPRPKRAVATPQPASGADQPLCGGCGAKVGATALDSVLRDLPYHSKPDVVTGVGDDAAVLKVGDTHQVISTDHLRAFWPDPYIMARIAAVHALGDVWAMNAVPQAMLAQIILPRMEDRLQSDWLGEIMAAASEVAAAAGCAIVGGHTTLGAELTIGFTVTGIATEEPIGQSGGQPGDALILTRPLGSGILLAAEMAKKAKGRDIASALNIMGTPQGDAARAIGKVCRAMTDVTGFGFAGHLARMATGAGLSAEIQLDQIPVFDGALELAEAGVRSSLFEANRGNVLSELPETAKSALLFDPQTAGGFLAAVPLDKSGRLLDELSELGHQAACVGVLTPKQSATIRAC